MGLEQIRCELCQTICEALFYVLVKGVAAALVYNLCFVLCLIKVTSLHYMVRDAVDVQPV